MNSGPFFFVFRKYSSAGWQNGVRVKSELKRMDKILLNTGVESKCQHFFSTQRYLLFMGVQQASKTEWSLRFNTASGLSSVCLLQIKVLLLRSIPSSVLVMHLSHTNLFLRVICTNSQNKKQWFRTAFFVYSLILNASAWGAKGRV